MKASYFLLSVFLLMLSFSYHFCMNYESLTVEVDILSSSCLTISFPLVLDWVSMFFCTGVVLISGCVLMFSSFYMDHEEFPSRFVGLVLLFVLSMSLLIFIPSLFGLMIGWDGLGVISFLLVIYYQNKSSLGAGMITVMTNRIGDVLFILSIGLVSGVMSWSFIDLSDWVIILTVVGFIIVGSMTKSAQIPFSAWLPAAMAAPTPVSALVHSSTLVTAGVYVLVRFSGSLWGSWGVFLMIMAILTVVMAGLSASFETDLKKVIALSTLSQLGMMMLIISVGMMNLCVFHLVTHALFKALMFMCAGAIIHLSGGVQDSRCFSGLWYKLPIINSWLVVACLSLMGIPFMAGFYSKDLILEWCLMNNLGWAVVFLLSLGTFLTAFYSCRFLYLSMSVNDFSSLSNFNQSDMKLILSASFLGLGAVFSGFIFQDILSDLNVFVYLSFLMKVSIPCMVFLGAIFSLLCFSSYKMFLGEKGFYGQVKMMLSINMKMWFLPFISGSFMALPFLSVSSKALLGSDIGWVEGVAGGKGVGVVVSKFSSYNSLLQSGLLGIYFSVGLVSVFFLFVLFLVF